MEKLKIIKIVKFGLIPALIFTIVFLSHIYSPVVTLWDSTFVTLVVRSIINKGSTNLDEYESIIKREAGMSYSYEYINGHYYWLFPIGTPLIAVPVYFVYKYIAPVLYHRTSRSDDYVYMQLFIASFIVALTALFIYLIAYFSTANTVTSLLVVAIFAFCTSAWSVASRALWQHGPSMLMLSLALSLILLSKKKPWLIKFAGLPLAFSYLVRPTNMISIVLFTFFVFLEYRQYFFSYLLWSLLIFVPFISYNLGIYNSFLSSYYMPLQGSHNFGSCDYFWVALVGHLFSPSRGIFIFSPILLLSLYGMFLKLNARKVERLDLFLILIIFMHWIAISCYSTWTGDYSIGNRVFSDMVPYFVFFLIPVITRIMQMKRFKQLIAIFIFFGLMAVSFMIHYRCVTELGPARWNDKLFENKWNINSKVWDWQDIQFLN